MTLGSLPCTFQNKEINNKKHFKTWHGRFGLATFLILIGSAIGGVVNKYNQGRNMMT